MGRSLSPADRAGHQFLHAAHPGLSAVETVSCDGPAVTLPHGPIWGTLNNDMALDSLRWTHSPAGLMGPECSSYSQEKRLGCLSVHFDLQRGQVKMEQKFKDSALGALRTVKEDAGPAGHVTLTPRCSVTSAPFFLPVPAQYL